MKAIILAAGLGTRLNEITKVVPKALVKVAGTTMLETVILKLSSQGITDFLVNIHHKGQDIIDFLIANDYFGLNIQISDERDQLLNTGGAILKARDFISGSEPVLIHNVDIVSDVNINELLEYHNFNNCIATLCVRKRDTNRYLLFDDDINLIGWTNQKTDSYKWVESQYDRFKKLAFSGIYLINPDFVNNINQRGELSIIDSWLDIAKRETILGYLDESDIWHDLGTIERIKNAEK